MSYFAAGDDIAFSDEGFYLRRLDVLNKLVIELKTLEFDFSDSIDEAYAEFLHFLIYHQNDKESIGSPRLKELLRYHWFFTWLEWYVHYPSRTTNMTVLGHTHTEYSDIAIRQEDIFSVPESLNLLPGHREYDVVYRGVSHKDIDALHVQARDEKRTVEFHMTNVSSWTKSYAIASEFGLVYRTTVSKKDVLVDTTKIRDFNPQLYHIQQHEVILKPGVYRCVECKTSNDCGTLEEKAKRKIPLVVNDENKNTQDFDFYTAQVLFFETFEAFTGRHLDPFASPQHWQDLAARQEEPVNERAVALDDGALDDEYRDGLDSEQSEFSEDESERYSDSE
jgi:hypothetical protein